MDNYTIRRAEKSDIPLIFSLVKELALFERAPEEVTATEADYVENGFRENPLFDCFLLFEGDSLEDLFVKEEFRGKGYGKILIEATIEEAKRTKSSGMMWQVLDWNTPAIKFYERYGVKLDGEWINVHLNL
jgi:GNAT superfamily N-acetyltransferase